MRGLIQYYPLLSVSAAFLAGVVALALAAFLKALSKMAEVSEDGDDYHDFDTRVESLERRL